ncbi:MAG: hypothetical protein AB1426_07730 [Bacillota bacterium]
MKEKEFIDYYKTVSDNLKVFLRDYHDDFNTFLALMDTLQRIWAPIGTDRDLKGNHHAGLVPFVNLLVRHLVFGFQHIVSYQSFIAWLAFRPGLEAFLIIGKFVDDPVNAQIWLKRNEDRKSYGEAFFGKSLVSESLSRSADFQKVLSRLNDNFMHPNPNFTYRDMVIEENETSMFVKILYFDDSPELHEAHLLSYLNLLNEIVTASEKLMSKLFGTPRQHRIRKELAQRLRTRALYLLSIKPFTERIMKELGLIKL